MDDRHMSQVARGRMALMAALSVGIAAGAAPAMAQQAAGEAEGAVMLPTLGVEGEAIAPSNKPEQAASPKYTAPLRDTPQTITVVPAAVIKEQNLLNLRDILSTVPGITFGAGEGGGGYGDSINLRGYTANSDIAIDGVRDSAQYVRSDPFNLEQLEVTNGANSVYAGSGAVGGSINLVSKAAKDDSFTTASAGIGTDAYYRATIDTNQKIDDGTAVRLNAMWHRNDVPGRDVEEYKRWGVAPSVVFGLNTDTQFTLSYFHQEDDNVPQYGLPYFQNAYHNGMLPGVEWDNYYGYSNLDRQDSQADIVTAKLEHRFTDRLSVQNLTRWQRVTQYAVVNPPQGTWCLYDGTNASTGAACAAAGTYAPSGPRGNTRDTRNSMLFNQTDLKLTADTGGIRHNLTLGMAVFSEKFHLDTGNWQRNPGGATPNPTLPAMDIANPDHVYTGPLNYVQTQTQDGTLENQAVYLFDQIKLNDQFEINGGLRWEHNKGDYTAGTYTGGVFSSQGELYRNTDSLFSYRAGLVYKPAANGSFYIAYGNSKTPSKSAVNGSCTAGSGATFVNNCNVDPETARNYEIGTKWDLLDNQLSLTAAIFRNERSNYKVPSADPLVPEYQLRGKSRVDGASLGIAGTVTQEWRVFANYTYLDSEVLRGADEGLADPTRGNPLTSIMKHSGSLWTTYDLPAGVQLGYGVTYYGRMYLNNSGAVLYRTPDFWVHRASASYWLNEETQIQVNVNNLFDKHYFTRIRNNGWATPGDARSATLTVNYTF
ncbi:TonB-dependent receptor [Niveispirillum fermenti]|uniref:TonB-dependent receptor n=2 Tax=Niveispirillum fermenti TaxID=1233113 RepID=UPI003A8AFD6D